LLADEKQPSLFAEEAGEAETTEEAKPQEFSEVKSHKRNKAGRKPIDPNLKREPRTIDIPESGKTCACGAALTRTGEEISEKLIIVPPKIYVDQIIRPKYACRCCEGTEDEGKPAVRIAPVEPSIIPKGIASASLLGTIFTQKFETHLPYYRQEKQFEQIGVTISRQDMANWQQQAFTVLKPLFILLTAVIKTGPVLEKFKEWLEKRKCEVPPSLLPGKEVEYSLAQWDKLVRYLESPYLTPDNNACENAIRPFVLGRKNWLFCQSPDGAKSSCGMYTLIETAKRNGLKPFDYLTALFEKAPLASSPQDWEKLLPEIFLNLKIF
jgi:transposase